MAGKGTDKVRPAREAGRFYPGDAAGLREALREMLADSAGLEIPGEVPAVMAPHAGYVYSGRIAAPAYRALAAGGFDTLVIIGHDLGRQAGEVLGVLPTYSAFATPLGVMEVDVDAVRALTEGDPRFICRDSLHDRDQTIEVHLPFLQFLGIRCRILPMFFGLAGEESCRSAARALRQALQGRRAAVLASTDLSHYPTDAQARRLDARTLSFIRSRDLAGLCAWQRHREEWGVPDLEIPICSAGGVGVAMLWAEEEGAAQTRVLRTGNSSDAGGDPARVVGYASLAFVRESNGPAPRKDTGRTSDAAPEKEPDADADADAGAPGGGEFSLGERTRRILLRTAYRRIRAGIRRETWRRPEWPDAPAELKRPAAVFVTLEKEGRLRGCIGIVEPLMSLQEAVEHFAFEAAFKDPRFRPVEEAELPLLDIEISVLSPMRRVRDAGEIVPGVHGVMIGRGRRRGLFLPQVWQQLPDRNEFLTCLCLEKAGLPADAWKDPDCDIRVFTVSAFQEDAASLAGE